MWPFKAAEKPQKDTGIIMTAAQAQAMKGSYGVIGAGGSGGGGSSVWNPTVSWNPPPPAPEPLWPLNLYVYKVYNGYLIRESDAPYDDLKEAIYCKDMAAVGEEVIRLLACKELE